MDIYRCPSWPNDGFGISGIPNSQQTVTYVLNGVTFEGKAAGDIYRALRERDIVTKALPSTMVVTDALQPRNYNALRFSTHIYNSEAELDRLTEALAELTR